MPICRWLGKVSSDLSNPANWDIYPPTTAGWDTIVVIGSSRRFPENVGAGGNWPTFGGENWPSSYKPKEIHINTNPYSEEGGGSASGVVIGSEDNPLKLPVTKTFIGGGRYVPEQPNWDMEGSEIYIQQVSSSGPLLHDCVIIEGFADTSGGNLPPSGTTTNGAIVELRGNPNRVNVRHSENLDIRHLETLGTDGATKTRNGPVETFTCTDFRAGGFFHQHELIPDLPGVSATAGHLRRCKLTLDWQKNANGGNGVQAEIDSKDSDIYIVADEYKTEKPATDAVIGQYLRYCLKFRCGRVMAEPSQQQPIFDAGDGVPNKTRIYIKSTKPLGTENANLEIPELQIGNSHWYDGEAPKLYIQSGVTMGPGSRDVGNTFNNLGRGFMIQNAEAYFTEDIATNVIINEGAFFGGNRGGELSNPRGTLIDGSALPAGAFLIKDTANANSAYKGVLLRREAENSYIHIEPPYRANILLSGITG